MTPLPLSRRTRITTVRRCLGAACASRAEFLTSSPWPRRCLDAACASRAPPPARRPTPRGMAVPTPGLVQVWRERKEDGEGPCPRLCVRPVGASRCPGTSGAQQRAASAPATWRRS
ncbi:hypothetical protein PVAP13_7KG012067 [Panicum virgatum]|uniref:Uncharacterized protein n=1 Tax=Panicum virgatum TaxID=38727 RepID=A0A8T0Q8I2_PANVG|nr:hypothetical protein PVAP13_7KG012067 [Panicum virgatum]